MTTKSDIPIVYITDNRYVEIAAVSIYSLLKNKRKETNYKVYVLGIDLAYGSVDTLKRISKDIEIIHCDNKYKNMQLQNDKLSPATFLKVDIPQIFTQYDKVLYLDSDTTIHKDLTDLYNIDITDYYAGVAKDTYFLKDKNSFRPEGIKDYFNAGVILFNCAKNRQDNMYQKITDVYKLGKYNEYGDQNGFNICWNEKVKFISFRYNFFPTMRDVFTGELARAFKCSEREIVEMKYHYSIIHYAGIRHLHRRDYPLANVWNKYYDELYGDKKIFKFWKWKLKIKDLLVLAGICNKDYSVVE